MNDFVGNILQNKFYACFYILLSGTALNAEAHYPSGVNFIFSPGCKFTPGFTLGGKFTPG